MTDTTYAARTEVGRCGLCGGARPKRRKLCLSCAAIKRAETKAYREANAVAGKCRSCPSPSLPDRKMCAVCLAADNARPRREAKRKPNVMSKMIEMLAKLGPSDATLLGARMWPDRKGRSCSASGGGDYRAQMLLGRARAKGYVRTQIRPGPGCSIWEATEAGLGYLEAVRDAA